MKKIVIAPFFYVETATAFLMYMEATELSRLIMLSSRSVRSLDFRRI